MEKRSERTAPRKRGGHGAATNRRNADLFAQSIAPIIKELRASGIVLPRAVSDKLSKRQVATARGGTTWHPTTVARLLARLADTLSAAEHHAGTTLDHDRHAQRAPFPAGWSQDAPYAGRHTWSYMPACVAVACRAEELAHHSDWPVKLPLVFRRCWRPIDLLFRRNVPIYAAAR
jgi:hypothetical protein